MSIRANISILSNPFQEFLNQNSLIIKWMSILANPLQEYIYPHG
jgi:hypothetical protein